MAFDPDAPDAFAGVRGTAAPEHRKSRPLPDDLDFSAWPLDELLAMHSAIEAVLPIKALNDMDLSRELVLQVQSLQQLQIKVQDDEDTPANQRAQVANSLSSALVNLVKLQTEVYTSERFKMSERFVIDLINSLPTHEAREAALEHYAKTLEGGG